MLSSVGPVVAICIIFQQRTLPMFFVLTKRRKEKCFFFFFGMKEERQRNEQRKFQNPFFFFNKIQNPNWVKERKKGKKGPPYKRIFLSFLLKEKFMPTQSIFFKGLIIKVMARR